MFQFPMSSELSPADIPRTRQAGLRRKLRYYKQAKSQTPETVCNIGMVSVNRRYLSGVGITALRSSLRLRQNKPNIKGEYMNTIQQAAKMEYQERMKQRLAGAPMPLEILMQSEAPITQQQMDAINKKPEAYENRERIPEPLLGYADLYHELTGQEPTKRTFTDWLDTFYAWKDEKLQEEHIRMAWAQAQSDKGFTVGRPGALTVTAVGMKSKAKPALPAINTAEVERTKAMLEKKNEGNFVPRPANVARPRIGVVK